jgi:hypothetical protein
MDGNKFRIGKLHDLCCSPDIIRVTTEEDEMGETCSMCRGKRNSRRGFVGKHKENKLEDLDVDGGISEWLLKGHDG